LAVFTKKCGSFVYRHFIDEPSSHALAADGLVGQSAGQRAIFYASECVDYAAYAGIDASDDAETVLDGPKDAYCHVLSKLGARQNFLALESYKPAIVTYVNEPVNLLSALLIQCESSDDVGDGSFITNYYTELVRPRIPG
jgi:hypothetical protein